MGIGPGLIRHRVRLAQCGRGTAGLIHALDLSLESLRYVAEPSPFELARSAATSSVSSPGLQSGSNGASTARRSAWSDAFPCCAIGVRMDKLAGQEDPPPPMTVAVEGGRTQYTDVFRATHFAQGGDGAGGAGSLLRHTRPTGRHHQCRCREDRGRATSFSSHPIAHRFQSLGVGRPPD